MSDELFRLYDPEAVGKDGYPPEWHQVKHLVREQAGYRCVRCGHPYPPGIAKKHPRGEWTPCDEFCTHTDGETRDDGDLWREARWRILTVHHLDGNKWNLLWWNLAALCQRCHLGIQTRVRMEQVYPFEHSEWFKPFAAGYYAFHYHNEELTFDEATRRMDELLNLERIS